MLTETAPLLPRYQRPLTFGAVLDETFQLFRKRWLALIGILLVTIIPYVVIIAIIGGAGLLALSNQSSFTPERFINNPAAVVGLLAGLAVGGIVVGLLFVACQLAADAAAILVSDAAMRGQQLGVGAAFRRGLPRLGALLGAALLLVIFVLGLAIVSVALLVPEVGGLLGVPVALIGLIVWAASPGARRPWLKWLIILATPFGLTLYYGTRWSLYGRAVVLENAGPLASLRRSADLVQGQWFRVWGSIAVISLIAAILQAIPSLIVTAIVTAVLLGSRAAGASAGTPGSGTMAFNLFANAASLIGWVLFGGLVFVALTVLFEDLRNRREGADLTERIAEQETGAAGSF